MVPLKSEFDLKMMRKAGSILARIIKRLQQHITAGITTAYIDSLAQEFFSREGVVSAFKGYRGYPAHICTSVNEEIVHGIPSQRVLMEGDILSLDLGIKYEGYFSDAAVTLPIGSVGQQLEKLIEVTKKALFLGIRQARVGNQLSDVSSAIQNYVEGNGFSVVRQFVGHGIGKNLHEEPEVPNFVQHYQQDLMLTDGMVLAIEPMVNMGGWEAEILDNGWTAVTIDRLPSAHFEHTVAITEKGPEILTQGETEDAYA